ncbi:hypothetical protein B0H16DRAFT_1715481 [Mycena metata]|uniref:Mitochondrial carrier protein n=1 Tax=Mycena metata TaxID=1033252 RepID=A0AAD7NP97_9AGAR|nr:hypothetical protein B0H16DRAFT_1715481 [Mycena metata]
MVVLFRLRLSLSLPCWPRHSHDVGQAAASPSSCGLPSSILLCSITLPETEFPQSSSCLKTISSEELHRNPGGETSKKNGSKRRSFLQLWTVGHPDNPPGHRRLRLCPRRARVHNDLANETGGAGGATLTRPQRFLAGVLTGLANGFLSGPEEHIRIRKSSLMSPQFNSLELTRNRRPANPPRPRPRPTPAPSSRSGRSTPHDLGGVFKGQNVTFVREAAGYGVYFLAYEKLVQRELRLHPRIKREELSPVKAGAATGYALWAIIYPIDMIKSRM